LSIGSRWSHPGFEVVEHLGARILARPEAVPWVRFVLESGKSLHTASAEDKDALRLEGRFPVFVIPAKISGSGEATAGSRWAIRHFARGGRFVSAVLQDRYFRTPPVRPYHEIKASEEARKRSISTPRVVAAATYTDGPFYRADLVTDFISNTSDLVDALFDTRRKGAGGCIRTAGCPSSHRRAGEKDGRRRPSPPRPPCPKHPPGMAGRGPHTPPPGSGPL